ncbi:MAG: hypothetical protein L0Y67_02910 [Gammaproteobacteria bacterium]|nr:hypothetical protein [Gammaproteobacteria bacterium]
MENKGPALSFPDPEVVVKATGRQFSTKYKLHLLAPVRLCSREIGGLPRREVLYSSHLTSSKRQVEAGDRQALGRVRGRKSLVMDACRVLRTASRKHGQTIRI